MPYENHYGVQLLDDIHNYFPAVLYEPERFRNVQELLLYIRSQTRNRFDLFSAGLASHAARHPARTQRISIQPLTTMVFDTDTEISTMATRLLRDMLHQSAVQAPMEPVVVRPTEQQISTATTIETVLDEGDMCAICQDTIASGTQVRTLNVCEHSFHTGCIDAWFRTNVHCPVCRHDIREA